LRDDRDPETAAVASARVRRRDPRRRRLRLRPGWVAGLAAVLLIVAAALFAASRGEEMPAIEMSLQMEPSPAFSAIAVAQGRKEVRTGKVIDLRYTIEGGSPAPLGAVLEVRASDGERVARVPLLAVARPGSALVYHWRADVDPGRYRYAVVLDDPTGVVELDSASAALVVTQPPGFPAEATVEKALAWAAARPGRVSVAVVDSNGRLYGLEERRRYRSASLVKAMLLVQYLRLRPAPDLVTDDVLRRMITESDNACADTIYAVVGQEGLRRLARRAGMRDFSTTPHWITTQVSAADQARFFMELESYVPKERRAFVREVLSGMVPRQRWGIVAASGPLGWATYFKAGWLNPNNQLVVQGAWLERGKHRFALAVLTDGNPGWTDGFSTSKGVTGILLGEEPSYAYLAQVLEP
jgi:hypothetical protein